MGTDSFESILLGDLAATSDSTSTKSHKLVRSEAEINDFVTADGITKNCFNKFKEFFALVFGPPVTSSKLSAAEAHGEEEKETRYNANMHDTRNMLTCSYTM